MRYWCFPLLFCTVALAFPANGDAAGKKTFTGKIVVHPDNQVRVIKRSELAAIFLGKKSTWDSGKRIIPTLQSENDSLTGDFLRKVLGKSASQYRAYWKRRLFSGGGTVPRSMPTSDGVMAFVGSHPGAIGIVDGSSKMDGDIVTVEISD